MGWRKIGINEVQRGLIVKIAGIEDGYNIGTIISTRQETGKSLETAVLARPFAYAHTDFDAKTPLVGTEVYEVSVQALMSGSFLLYESPGGQIRMMTT